MRRKNQQFPGHSRQQLPVQPSYVKCPCLQYWCLVLCTIRCSVLLCRVITLATTSPDQELLPHAGNQVLVTVTVEVEAANAWPLNIFLNSQPCQIEISDRADTAANEVRPGILEPSSQPLNIFLDTLYERPAACQRKHKMHTMRTLQ